MEKNVNRPSLRLDNSGPQREERPPHAFYSVDEAAAFMEVRADDLAAMLPGAGIDINLREKGLLTRDDVERLERLVRSIRNIPSESVYGGGNV